MALAGHAVAMPTGPWRGVDRWRRAAGRQLRFDVKILSQVGERSPAPLVGLSDGHGRIFAHHTLLVDPARTQRMPFFGELRRFFVLRARVWVYDASGTTFEPRMTRSRVSSGTL